MNRRKMLYSSSLLLGATVLSGSRLFFRSPANLTKQSSIQPFRIDISDESITDLHQRLDNVNWPAMPFDTGWSAGTNDQILRDLVHYWRHTYDWYKVQDALNALDHFRVPIEGEQLYFVRYEGKGKQHPFPLLLLHGWPSTFIEFVKAAPLLANGMQGQPGFDLVVPSLPGFAFSEAPQTPGMHVGKIADRLHTLMQTLGYGQYGVQGGDWGAVIGVEMARKYPASVKGLHYVAASATAMPENPQNDAEREYAAQRKKFDNEERAYFDLQSTKPQTLAYALQDSPVGLLAWILEKYWTWTDHGNDLWKSLDRNDVLTTVMLYWLTGHVLSAVRIYYETRQMLPEDWSSGPVPVPTAYARFPQEPWGPPRTLVNPNWAANLTQYNEMTKGGHFPALEVPDLWSKDVASFFSKL